MKIQSILLDHARRFPLLYHLLFGWSKKARFRESFEKTKSVFIHIPKCAGTSISYALYGQQIDHTPCSHWMKVNPYLFRKYFTYAIIREPYQRFVSAFYYLKDGGINPNDQRVANMYLSDVKSPQDLLLNSKNEEKINNCVHLFPQEYWISGSEGSVLVDYVVPLPFLDKCWPVILSKLGMSGDIQLKTRNVRSLDPHKVELSEEADKVFRRFYGGDIKLYNSILTKFQCEHDRD